MSKEPLSGTAEPPLATDELKRVSSCRDDRSEGKRSWPREGAGKRAKPRTCSLENPSPSSSPPKPLTLKSPFGMESKIASEGSRAVGSKRVDDGLCVKESGVPEGMGGASAGETRWPAGEGVAALAVAFEAVESDRLRVETAR